MENEKKIAKNTFGERIRIAREKNNLTRPQACDLLGVSKSTLQFWEYDQREPSVSQLLKLSAVYNVPLTWLLQGYETNEDTINITIDTKTGMIDIPMYDIFASAGNGCNPLNENVEGVISFPESWIKSNVTNANMKELKIITVKGDSMEPLLREGDKIMIHLGLTSPSDGIFLIKLDEQLFVKRIQPLPNNKIRILSINKEYEPYTINLDDPSVNFKIVGRVVWQSRISSY